MSNTMYDIIPLWKECVLYSLNKFRGDLVSGITIAIILIPQGLAYGQLAGLPSIWGKRRDFHADSLRTSPHLHAKISTQVFGAD